MATQEQPSRRITGQLVKSLVEEAKDHRRLCLLLGAGVSAAIAELPTWRHLVNELADLAIEVGNDRGVAARRIVEDLAQSTDPAAPLRAATDLKRLLQESQGGSNYYHAWLNRTFGSPRVRQPARLLATLQKIHEADRHIRFATTNYDTIVDRSLGMETSTWRDVAGHNYRRYFTERGNILFHAHGVYYDPATIVFAFDDYRYQQGANDNGIRPEPLERLLDEFTVLFVGCGGTLIDPHFARVFGGLQANERPQHVLFHRQTETPTLPPNSRILPFPYRDHADLPQALERVLLDSPPGANFPHAT